MAYGICSPGAANGELNHEVVYDIFFKERYEHLLKGIFATTT